MILQCEKCGKVKKFDRWVEAESLVEIKALSEKSIVKVLCPKCGKET